MGEPRQSIFYGQQVEEHDDATQAKRVIGTGGALATEAKQDTGNASLATIASTIATATNQNILDKYAMYDKEYGATYNYICKEDITGSWFIQRETVSSGLCQYAAGASDVATAWTNRASQTYGLFSATF